MTNKFKKALTLQNDGTPPIWLMRQAGRYHSHYQNLRQKHGFLELCRQPDLACEVTLGPIQDFDFDAAILFSDILFPIELMGPALDFNPGPIFDYYLKDISDLSRFKSNPSRIQELSYQAEALHKIRFALGPNKGLIGFVGGLLTLYIFAVEGTHKKGLDNALAGLKDGRFEEFMERMIPMLAENMVLQARAKPDCLAILDSAAGAFTNDNEGFFQEVYRPYVDKLIALFREKCPDTKLLYYAKNITLADWKSLSDLDVQAFGIDHSHHLPDLFDLYGETHALQGNLPPETMSMDEDMAAKEITKFLNMMKEIPSHQRKGWICGLGHGILPTAKENNVRQFINQLRSTFSEDILENEKKACAL